MYKAIIFDFDGLIVDTESVWYNVTKEVMLDYGYDLKLENFAKYIGTTGGGLYDELSAISTQPIDRELVKSRTNELYQQRKNQFALREGVLDYLQAAKEHGLKIGLASSSSRKWVVDYLERFKILHYFEVIKTSDDVQKVKPDPELYVKALQELGVESNEALCFEDSLNGLTAAVGAGLNCVIVPNPVTQYLDFKGHVHRLTSMSELSFDALLDHLAKKQSE
ncbi:HAD family hydrolase [Robertmurraya korlensis]|uniref:HAD family hydrolase n=1 Tax=Robertmurraya korlensis TaxID=519977 RepID=UPI00203A99DA|nr:HAD family hydrolase [Robertmurraya korlensis]MCM3601268.1 HAD family hydrolase [Robertmurraya korlensis]